MSHHDEQTEVQGGHQEKGDIIAQKICYLPHNKLQLKLYNILLFLYFKLLHFQKNRWRTEHFDKNEKRKQG